MAKRAIPPRRGEDVLLRLLTAEDLPLTLSWRNQPHIRRWFNHTEPLSAETHRAWFERYSEADDDYVFVIEETRELGRPVGQVSVYDIDPEGARAEFGRCIIGPPEATGRGLMARASRVVLDLAREDLSLTELYLQVKSDNAKAIHVYEQLGFEQTDADSGLIWMRRRLEVPGRSN